MKRHYLMTLALGVLAMFKSYAQDTPETPSFAVGADISWITEMEARGEKFYNYQGEERECTALMKELGVNAIRLRVWVDPKDGWNGKEDVLEKAERAHKLGIPIMIDFHYSDSWADPGQQFKPKAWKNKSFEEIKTALATHTQDILKALKAKGITPRWVQVGNEIRPGLLWDENVNLSGAAYDVKEKDVKGQNSTSEHIKYPKNFKNLVGYVNAGYDAVKAVFPHSIVIIHIDNAWDDQTWWFDQFKENGGKMDMIGLSHYPQTNPDKTWQEMNRLALTHTEEWAKKYGVKVMIAEVGVKQPSAESPQVLKEFMDGARQIKDCAGVFYWEPESSGWNGGYDMGAFKDGKPTPIMDAFTK